MLQRYRVRLSDGTVLTVDQDDLRSWLTDDGAAVQVPGTQEWRALSQYLTEEEAAARLARALVPPAPRREAALPPPDAPTPNARVERPLGEPPIVQALADDTGTPPSHPPREAAEVVREAPVIRLKPLADERPAPDVGWRARARVVAEEEADEAGRDDRGPRPLLQWLGAFGAFLSRCLDPLTRLVRESDSASRSTATPRNAGFPIPPKAAETRRSPVPTAERVAPPTPVAELPRLRLADTEEEPEEEDIYEGGEDDSLVPALWQWTKRIVLLGGLATGLVLAVLNWKEWFPRAAEVGQTAFTEIDRQVRSGQRTREQEQALRDATERLPHLGAATIRLVLATSESGVLEPPEVFQVASEAADRGLSALMPAEAAELRTLQRELLSHLRPAERSLVAEYDRARAGRAVFPFENPHVLELVAKGGRAMPERSRQRLQELLGKAVAAGLAPTAGSPGGRSR